jgi:hypothetical protein
MLAAAAAFALEAAGSSVDVTVPCSCRACVEATAAVAVTT